MGNSNSNYAKFSKRKKIKGKTELTKIYLEPKINACNIFVVKKVESFNVPGSI
jgi:hypothetical protein